MPSTSHSDTDQLVDTIRRTIRVLGAKSTHVSNPKATSDAARLLHGRLTRSGIPAQWIDGDLGTPLLVAGNGPVAISTYLDDSHPAATEHTGAPPSLDSGVINGPGIERKAGVIASMAGLLADPDKASEVTVIVETDRHSGSHTLENWIKSEVPQFSAVAWEVSDLPVPVPIAVRAATGSLIVEIRLSSTRRRVEPVYGTVLPDLGIAIAHLLATLKTADDEVRLEDFYEAIGSPGEDEFDALVRIAPGISQWLGLVANNESGLSTTHMTLGMFCAPSIIVRSISMRNAEDYLPETATAIVEFQLLPGQSITQILAAIQQHAQRPPFTAEVLPLLVRPPVAPAAGIGLPAGMACIPITPGPGPASIFDEQSIPTIGYALVNRDVNREANGLSLDAIASGSRFLQDLTTAIASEAPVAQ